MISHKLNLKDIRLSEEDLRPNPIASARDKTSISRKY
jgi:hypothetical protein